MQPPIRSRAPIGFLDALRDNTVIGWARDPQDHAAVAVVRLMRGLEVLAETEAGIARDDGMPGFRLRAPVPLTATELLEGRVRVRVLLPGRQAPFTLAMTARMRAALEAEAGWEPTTEFAAPPASPPPASPSPVPAPPPRRSVPEPPLPPPSARRPLPTPPPAPTGTPSADPAPAPPEAEPAAAAPAPIEPPPDAPVPAPREVAPVAAAPAPTGLSNPAPAPPEAAPAAAAPDAIEPPPADPAPAPAPAIAESRDIPSPGPAVPQAPVLRPLSALAAAADAAGIALLHLAVPGRDAVLAPGSPTGFDALEAEAATLPAVARDWVPLRAAFARDPNPGTLWRRDGRRLSVEGGVALLRTLLAVLRARLPAEAGVLARAEALVERPDLAALPRRDAAGAGGEEGPAFLGVPVHETEPDLTEAIFFDLPAPRRLRAVAGLEAWTSAGAPLPWRVLLLATPGLGGSAGPAAPGWWLRYLVAECVISEALPTAPPEAALAVQPGLILTLSDAG
ncbi:hypothetical protein [Falsiroseomonas sp. CW058]|uniref:hypothetical protein n=1 Tax=Falsiroseomonas sp. CW058 TaxID=3388664 RepID=UPI003D31B4A7